MKANELRIGNYLNYRDKERILIVSNLGSFRFETICHNTGVIYGSDDASEYNGIPLTEDWLLKFGFTLDIGVGVWFSTQKHFPIWNAYSVIPYQYTLDNPSHNINISTVHQLQNLYFALTGDELQLK